MIGSASLGARSARLLASNEQELRLSAAAALDGQAEASYLPVQSGALVPAKKTTRQKAAAPAGWAKLQSGRVFICQSGTIPRSTTERAANHIGTSPPQPDLVTCLIRPVQGAWHAKVAQIQARAADQDDWRAPIQPSLAWMDSHRIIAALGPTHNLEGGPLGRGPFWHRPVAI